MKITFYDANNNYHEGKIVAVFHHSNNNYIAYAKKDTINNKINILVGKYIPTNNNSIRIYDIPNQKEWDFINSFLMNKINGG